MSYYFFSKALFSHMKVKIVFFEEQIVGVYSTKSLAKLKNDVLELFEDFKKHRPYETPEQKQFVEEKFRDSIKIKSMPVQ
jgi:hypothetical protein